MLAVVATSCSSPTATNSAATSTTSAVTPKSNTGLCKLVAPSVIATALSDSMTFPETLAHGATTECIYRAKDGGVPAVLLRYDTDSSDASFAKVRRTFEGRGQTLGPITGLGDQAYYFSEQSKQGESSQIVTTVVVLKGTLQLLVTGTATLDQIGSIARFALNQYDAAHPTTPTSS